VTEERFRCQPASLARGDARLGTASTVKRWILIEQSGPWGSSALFESRLDRGLAERVQRLARQLSARPLLIKRSGRHTQTGCRVYVAATGRLDPWIEALDLPSAAYLERWDLSPLKTGRSVGGTRLEAPVFLVCTHGRHDACCAQYGRPVALALAGHGRRDLWECSHVGGDRFAGNLVCFPHGLYFGHLRPDTAGHTAELYEHGRIDLEHYRGRAAYPFPVQAAEGFLRRELLDDRIENIVLLGQKRVGDIVHARFRRGRAEQYRVDVRVSRTAAMVQLTCSAETGSHFPTYQLSSITRLAPRAGSEHPADR
jgi:hypothetical protein